MRYLILSILGFGLLVSSVQADVWVCQQADGTQLYSDQNITGQCQPMAKPPSLQRAPSAQKPTPGSKAEREVLPIPKSRHEAASKSSAAVSGGIIQIARAGQRAPNGNGIFSSIELPIELGTPGLQPRRLTKDGKVVFIAVLTGTPFGPDNQAICVGSPEAIIEIVRLGQPAPDGNGTFSSFNGVSIDNQGSGLVAFVSTLRGTERGFKDNTGIFLAHASRLDQIARTNQAIPDGSGVFSSLEGLSLNSKGEVAFSGWVAGPSGTNDITRGLFIARDGKLIQIARTGRPSPDGAQMFSGFSDPVINSKGQVAFVGYFVATTVDRQSGVFSANGAVYLWNGRSFDEIARVGQTAPDGDGVFSEFGAPSLNDRGQLAFQSYLRETLGARDTNGVYFATGGVIKRIAKSGQPASDGNGAISVYGYPRLNQEGHIVLPVTFTGTRGAGVDNSANFRWSEGAGLIQLLRSGDRALDGNGRISGMGRPRINERGQVTFDVSYTDTTRTTGIILNDGARTIEIARAGQPVPDGNGKVLALSHPAINDRGQIAFFATLADTLRGNYDNSGVYIWSPSQ